MASGVFSSIEGALVFGYRQMHVKWSERLSQLHDLKNTGSDWKRISNGTDVPSGPQNGPKHNSKRYGPSVTRAKPHT